MKTNSKPIQSDGNSDDFDLVCARTVAPSIPVPARDWEAHRRAIGTKFPLPITIKAPRAGPGPVCLKGKQDQARRGGRNE